MRDNVSFSIVNFFIIFRHWAGMFRPPHFFFAWLSKFHSPPPLEHFEQKNFLKKKEFPSISDMGGNVFSIVWKTFQARLPATIYKFTKKFRGKILYWNCFFLTFFWPMIGTFSVFVGQNSIGLSICILRVHWKNIGIKIWADFFPDIEEKLFSSLSKTMDRGCQNCNIRLHRIILGITISFNFYWPRQLQFFVGNS